MGVVNRYQRRLLAAVSLVLLAGVGTVQGCSRQPSETASSARAPNPWEPAPNLESSAQIMEAHPLAIHAGRILLRRFDVRGTGAEREQGSRLSVYDIESRAETRLPVFLSRGGGEEGDLFEDYVVYTYAEAFDAARYQRERSSYRQNQDIYLYDLKTGATRQLTTDPHNQSSPRIWGQHVVWKDTRHTWDGQGPGSDYFWDLFWLDLFTGEVRQITTSHRVQDFDVGDRGVVWADGTNVDNPRRLGCQNCPDTDSNILFYDFASGQTVQLTDQPGAQREPAISGNRVVWTDYAAREIVLYDLGTGHQRLLTDDGVNQFAPDISEDYVVWVDERRGHATNDVVVNGRGPNSDIALYDLAADRLYRLTGSEPQIHPLVDGEVVVFLNSRQVGWWTGVLHPFRR